MNDETDIRTDTAGTLLKIVAAAHTPLQEGDDLLIMESMKMEIAIQAPAAGHVTAYLFEEGALVGEDALVARFRAD